MIVAGGVAANKGLREGLKKACAEENINLIIPEMKYCTDNASMIASSAYFLANTMDSLEIEVFSRC